ncbi:MAG: PDZ domain-containing protein [Dehalococcoidia bacterium]
MVERVRSVFLGLVLLLMLSLFGATVPTPFVAVGRGPTFDTLGIVEGKPVVAVHDLPTYPTTGHLNMTTVGVTSGLSAVQVLGMWLSRDRQVLPRAVLVPPGETEEQAQARNARLFTDSQVSAEGAALTYLGLPVAVYVGGVLPGSAAEGQLERGDVLVAIAGRPVATLAELREELSGTRPGERATLTIRRGDAEPHDVELTLGSLPDAPQGALGILPAARPLREDEIVISLGDVGGPSAGLMFALAIVDKLTPGDLTGGRFVAGTGTIDSAGTVGEIEGIRFKMLAAREAGATVFLVPDGNCEEARGEAPDGLQTVRVADLTGAVKALDEIRSGGTPPSC